MLFIVLFLLIILSAFFSAAETALTAFSRTKLHDVEIKAPKKAKLLNYWLHHPNEILSGILVGNNIVNILSSSIATLLAITLWGSSSISVAIATASMTVLLLIFGEITPKIVAKTYSSQISVSVIYFIYILSKILLPITWVLMGIAKIILRVFRLKLTNTAFLITEEEIKSVVNAGEQEGVIEKGEKKMIYSIFDFNDTSVKEVMVNRTSMFSIECSKTIDELLDLIIENGYSRIPVYQNNIDNIIGILYQKDLFKIIREGNLSLTVGSCVRDVFFVPETKSLTEMLEEFKKNQIHIAVVINEYGGTAGLVTIEDLLEEIVGEIRDEFDFDESEDVKLISDGKYVVNALLDVDFVNEELNLDIPLSKDYNSIGGYLYASLGRIPLEKDRIICGNTEIIVIQVKNRRVEKVVIKCKQDKIS